jgi:hypothetical protein
MPNRNTDDEREKLDHSSHPTSSATEADLNAPGAGAAGKEGSDDLQPPPDDEDRIRDFYARHGGAGNAPRRFASQGGLQGWSEIEARDGHVLRCEWSRFGSREEIAYSEVAPSSGTAPTHPG